MIRAVVILLTLGCALAGPNYMKYFKIEPALNRPAPEYPSDSLKSVSAHGPVAGAVYKLSYADYHQTWESFKNDHSK